MKICRIIFSLCVTFFLCSCVAQNIKSNEVPGSGEGIAFIRVYLSGADMATVLIYSKGSWFGASYKARINVQGGDNAYAVILPEGSYEIREIRFKDANNRLLSTRTRGSSHCYPFKVVQGVNNYAGTLLINIITNTVSCTCNPFDDAYKEALSEFKEKYSELYLQRPSRMNWDK